MRMFLAPAVAALLLVGPVHPQQRNPLELLKADLAARQKGKPAKTEQSALQELRGAWKVTAAPPFSATRLVFEEEKVIIFSSDTFSTERRFKINPKAKPAHIDVLAGESKAAGIYELSGNTLRICVAKWNAERPSEFKNAKGIVCLTLTRESEKAGDDKKEAPRPLPPQIVKAWRDAGFEVGWVKDVPPHLGSSWGFWRPWREKGEAGAIPAFGHPRRDAGGVLAKLPDPGTAFGLDFHCGWDAGVPLKEFAKCKNLQSLNLGAVRSPDRPKAYADLKDLAELTNLRALYLFYMPVADADLKHIARLKKLRVLDLSSTRVTDAGLKELAALKDLQWLNLQTARLTPKAVAALQKELPHCKILTYDSAAPDSPKQKQPTNKEKLIGVWEWQEEWGGTWRFVPRTGPATIEFTKDGKIKTSDKAKGTYQVDGDVLKVTFGERAVTWKIGRLDNQALVLEEGQFGLVDGKDKFRMRWFKRKDKADPQPPATTREIPKAWRLEDIEDAAPPRSDAGPTHVLAWKIVEDDRPLRLEYCLVLKELKKPKKDKGQWVLASLVRNPAKGKEWNFVTIWISPDPDFKNPPFIMHIEEYKDRPKNVEIYRFMDKYRWTLGSGDGWNLIDGGVCAAWEKAVCEKPTRSFKNNPKSPEQCYKIDPKMFDKIQDGMTETAVRKIIGGPPHAEWSTVFAAPFSGKAMPVTLRQWWGEKNLIEVHFDGPTDEVIYKRILDGIDRRFSRQSKPKADPELTPEACKQALLEMMRSKSGQALGFFEKKLVDEMEKMPVEKKKEEYHWTGAYRFNPPGKKTFVLFVGLLDGVPPLRPHPKGYLIHLRVYQGAFELRDGRWIATVPKWKYNLLD
jgi:uncharacterized protein (TIGR03067 family)